MVYIPPRLTVCWVSSEQILGQKGDHPLAAPSCGQVHFHGNEPQLFPGQLKRLMGKVAGVGHSALGPYSTDTYLPNINYSPIYKGELASNPGPEEQRPTPVLLATCTPLLGFPLLWF